MWDAWERGGANARRLQSAATRSRSRSHTLDPEDCCCISLNLFSCSCFRGREELAFLPRRLALEQIRSGAKAPPLAARPEDVSVTSLT